MGDFPAAKELGWDQDKARLAIVRDLGAPEL